MIVGSFVTPALGMTTSLTELGTNPCVQLVIVFQSVLVTPFHVISVSTSVTVGLAAPPGSGSSVKTLMPPAAVTVPCVCTCLASGGVFTVAEYLMVIDLPPAGNVAIVLRETTLAARRRVSFLR